MQKKKNLVWIDLEMTGLDPAVDHILEVAAIVTDEDLNPLDEGIDLVIHQGESVLQAMNPWCIEQHGASGLTDAVRASTITVEQAQEQVLALVRQFCDPKKGVLCGNSVWMDRMFLSKYMPDLIDYLHYRLVDVSSLKELITRWYPHDPYAVKQKSDTHRALTDIHESIAELKQYREDFFKK